MPDKHDFTTVDKDRIVICDWCGTAQSDEWVKRVDEVGIHLYCSKGCQLADNVQNKAIDSGFLLGVSIAIIILSILLLTNIPNPGIQISVLFVSISLEMICLACYQDSYGLYQKGRTYREEVPKGSRSDMRELDMVVLEKASISATCPKCGAALNLADVEPDRIYKCKYCGSEGIIEWPFDDEAPSDEQSTLF
ncbi:MAG: hypothetical protein ACFFAY_10465 [Promethearchaeota archaeon]